MNHTISDTDYVELSTFAEEQWHKVLNYLVWITARYLKWHRKMILYS